ncbi:MAG: GNAT family N-acetyltransferase [Candidatus Marsarchaeota archaeon]|nr:GNAT family N-acetyltransferase [Candidatus Marsarchaeota archaeon]
MKNSFAIRETKPQDFTSVKKLLSRAKMGSTLTKATFERTLIRNGGLCLVAKDGKRIVGTIFGFDDVLTLHLSKLTIDEAYRGHGIGKLLINELINRTKTRNAGISRIFLHVRKNNKAAMHLYKSLGFEVNKENCLMDLQLKRK